MDRESKSPEPESIECGGSPEASSTRPNPFKDGGESLRKRRRTSLNVDSRSRSAESGTNSPHDNPGGTSTATTSPSTIGEPNDSAMAMDESPASPAPHTPEANVINVADAPPPSGTVDIPPSHVTLSLRNSARHTLDTIPSSAPSSPTPSGRPHAQDTIITSAHLAEDTCMASVENGVASGAAGDDDLIAVPANASLSVQGQNPSSIDRPRTSSPPIEVVDIISDDEEDSLASAEPHVTILPDTPAMIQFVSIPDPTGDFPYLGNGELPADIMMILIGPLTQDASVPQQLLEWIDRYIIFAKTSTFETVYQSFMSNRALWLALPDLIWGVPNLRHAGFGAPDLATRLKVLSFCHSFARLAAHFVDFELQILDRIGVANVVQSRDHVSTYYLLALAHLTKREISVRDEDRMDGAFEADDTSSIIEQFALFHEAEQGGTLSLMSRLLETQVAMMPTYPKISEVFARIIAMASNVTREAYRNVARVEYDLLAIEIEQDTFDLGQKIYTDCSAALDTAISNHITTLAPEATSQMINALGDLVYIHLKVDEQEAVALAGGIEESYPMPLECIPDAFAMKWRFTMFCRLIKNSQMQLRLMAITSLCQELVGCWRRYGDQVQEHLQDESVLRFVTNVLSDAGLVSYMLGPTCHPEITSESGNIIGFLAVTRTYTNAHTDLFWQTVTTAQDPRIAEALLRTMCRTVNLLPYDSTVYLCKGFLDVHISAFTPPMREFFDALFRNLTGKAPQAPASIDSIIPYDVCLQLLRESSVASTRSPVAYPDVQSFAIEKLVDCLRHIQIDADQRKSLYQTCLADLTQKSQTTLGSLCAIHIINRRYGGRDLSFLTDENGLTELVVDDLEHALQRSRHLPFPAVINGTANTPRRDMIFSILQDHSSTLTPDLSSRLWEMMVGPAAACKEDRNASWNVLIACAKKARQQRYPENNTFLTLCLEEFLPHLPPSCFCEALLEFLRDRLLPLLVDISCNLLDKPSEKEQETKIVAEDDKGIDRIALEQLWRIVLTAPSGTIESLATHILVNEVYIESRFIQAISPYRSRKIHLALVRRCLQQLHSAAINLKTATTDVVMATPVDNIETKASLEEPPSEVLVEQQELLFIRSLKVLQEFLRAYRTSPQFSIVDLRHFISGSPKGVEGEPAELKYQSFDGDNQTEVKPLNIGRQNTAAALLASLKEATGFENYRIFYRGKAFTPKSVDICRSLEDLKIHNGLILVKRDVDPDVETEDNYVGGSPVESEILCRFKELWEYLSMEERLSREIHEFLIQLPINKEFLSHFDKDDLAYTDVFYIGQPYKSLFALHSLHEYLTLRLHQLNEVDSLAIEPVSSSKSSETADVQMETPESTDVQLSTSDAVAACSSALATAVRLTTSAICDPDVTQVSANASLQVQLNIQLLKMLNFVLSCPQLPSSSYNNLDAKLLDRLIDVLSTESENDLADSTCALVKDAFEAVMKACTLSREFWEAFKKHEKSTLLIIRILFLDDRLEIRQLAESHIGGKFGSADVTSTVAPSEFREFFWPIVLAIVPQAIGEPAKCEGVFNLADGLFRELLEASSPVLDIGGLLRQTGDLLLSCTTSEDVTRLEYADYAVYGLTRLFLSIYRAWQNLDLPAVLPANFMNKLFWKHLFPPWRNSANLGPTNAAAVTNASYPRIVVNSQTRALLMKVIADLIEDDINLLPTIIKNLDKLVPCERSEDDEPYHYELSATFEPTKALRAPCGYAGLRNLSNTCYFNSLFTQLFMNVPFRQFMMSVPIRDESDTQSLLFQTRVLFGYLQNSIRRFVDTEMCVGSVKTYDDTLIDIHNQMDVDEFYNLLFDRWEGQIESEDDKKSFRSFFGGRIVQQVRSKECEHVSERLEPFSAIQCDIKGKASLQESLEAYVEGEIMEGDNKYNCSSCDRHVDAIKRACLKDIPDHLIFHLKRFDFNLRTLQRSKINDYFSFPHEIDMRPYTIDQLSNPSEEQTADMFELVGVLVHSGTAESGHYYSYIRERPSSKADENWVEFNDDTVSTWDHSLMEAMCFGGTDSRSFNQYGTDGGNYGIPSEKVYSAYMLFYQRSSSLARDQDVLAQSGLPSPVKVAVPVSLADHLQNENTSMVRRHALYDPQHIPFVSKMLNLVQFATPNGECTLNHKIEDLAIQMALSHLDQVAARTKDIPDFATLFNSVVAMGKKCEYCSLAIFDYFDERPDVLRQMVQRSIEPSVRADMGRLLIASLQIIKEAFPRSYSMSEDDFALEADRNADLAESATTQGRHTELNRSMSIINGAALMMQTLWEHFHLVQRSWTEVFGFMIDFVNMGREELGIFLDLEGFRRAILTVSADSAFPLDAQFSRLVIALQRRNRAPSFQTIISLIRTLLMGMYPLRAAPRSESEMFVSDGTSRLRLARDNPDGDLPMNRLEYNIMDRDWNREFGNVFVDKLISLDQNIPATNNIIARLMATHPAMEGKVFMTIKANITSNSAAVPQAPFLRAAIVFMRHIKSPRLASQMMIHLSEQCRGLANNEGRCFFETFRGLLYGSTGTTGQIDVLSLLEGLRYIPTWAPGLLCYFDNSVSLNVESFLQDVIFQHGPDPQFDEDDLGLERARMLKLTAKRLGVEMLQYIQSAFIEREIPISSSIAAILQRLVTQCAPYYEPLEEDMDDPLSLEFHQLSTAIPDLLNQLIVDDIEEEGSDWNSSHCSSEAGDSIGDTSMQTAGEMNDADMP